MRKISYELNEAEASWSAVRSQGAGGQNVNKVSRAVQLRFDVRASSLPEKLKERILALRDRRVTAEGVIVIRSETERDQPRNLAEAWRRLRLLIEAASEYPDFRIPTKPTRASVKRRREGKKARSAVKQGRKRVTDFS